MLKAALLSSSVSLIISTAAYAADAVVDLPPAPVEPVSERFCDAYAGVQAGYVWDETEYSGLIADFGMLDSYLDQGKNDGGSGGLYAGCNFRSGPMLWGVEGDINMMDVGYGDSWYGTLRLRGGATLGNTLLFATGGVAFGEVDMISGNSTVKQMLDFGMGSVDTPTAVGWTLGAGVEHWFSERISWKTEYLYMDLGRVGTFSVMDTDYVRADWTAHTVRTGVAVHF